ncbi:hypothetical protein [Pontibacter sp. SGAir0037]|uniref:hypothetical protein n=1 Tax=Pontibacter sp. SGAir0037 TaxID=2571030 RepID=UPI001F0F8609|nr:hypothetical protein [Pontibacter sp. SGAir0037]
MSSHYPKQQNAATQNQITNFTKQTYFTTALKTVLLGCSIVMASACTQEKEASQATQVTEAASPETPPAPAPADTAVQEVAEAPEADSAWEYPGPKPLKGAILPQKRVIAFYGNLLSKRMGILGELPPEQMLSKLDEEVANWEKADSLTPVQPALHAIVVTAQGSPGKGAKYRLRMTDKMIDDVLEIAKKRDAIVFLDVQIGRSTLQEELPRLTQYLQLPNVHLGVDAEFAMGETGVPGKRVGSFDAADLNYASGLLADLVKEHQLPPKLFIVHRFTQRMITNYKDIKLRPEVQVVMHMDGWGSPALKKDTYRRYIKNEPVQFTGFKLFYKNDTKKGHRLMTPAEILALEPKPLYIQYQ